MLQLVQSYLFAADYRNVLDFLFRTGETGIFGQKIRLFRDGRDGSLARECLMEELPCVGHTTCLATEIVVQLGRNYPNRQAIAIFRSDNDYHYEVHTGSGMIITLDQKKQCEGEASLWIQTDSREWLRSRVTPSLVRLENGDIPTEAMPAWLPTFPGDMAIKFCYVIWQQIIDDINAYLKPKTEAMAEMKQEETKALISASAFVAGARQSAPMPDDLTDGEKTIWQEYDAGSKAEGIAAKVSLSAGRVNNKLTLLFKRGLAPRFDRHWKRQKT